MNWLRGFVLSGVMAVGAVGSVLAAWPDAIKPVLSESDARVYRNLFDEARAGKLGSKRPKDTMLMGHVQAELYQSPKYKTGYGELVSWLGKYDDYPQAVELYRLALEKMPRPKTVCKGKGKKRTCETVGSRAAPPPMPLAIRKRELAQQASEEARKREYDSMDPVRAEARRRVVSQSWKLRTGGKLGQALDLLDSASTRALMGDERWQAELVWIADTQLAKQGWSMMRRASRLAAQAQGPKRDEALWWLGLSSYRLGDRTEALKAWSDLVAEEPIGGKHFAKGAWWAARLLEERGDKGAAREMLIAARQDGISFYSLLAAKKLGEMPQYSWASPLIDGGELQTLASVPAARKALALAQVNEIALAQMQFRVANEDIPSNVTQTLAALALKLHLPATALQMGRMLLEDKQIVPAALYPLPEQWRPMGPATVDRALLLAIMRQESAFHPGIGSHAGAQGLMQVMPKTAKYIVGMTGRGQAHRDALHDPENNMTLGQDYLAYLQGKTDGNLIATIAAYNGGIGNVNKWLNKPIADRDDPLLFIESIPFDETRDYVQKVMTNLWIYQMRMKSGTWSLAKLAGNRWPVGLIAATPDERDIGG